MGKIQFVVRTILMPFIPRGRRADQVALVCLLLTVFHPVGQLCVSNGTIETCVVNIDCYVEKFIIFAVYRPHSHTIDNFNATLLDLFNSDNLRGRKVILLGDFNIDIIDSNCMAVRHFIDDLQALSFTPNITKPSRFPSGVSSVTPSLLDHIWVSGYVLLTSGILSIDLFIICRRLPIFQYVLLSDMIRYS